MRDPKLAHILVVKSKLRAETYKLVDLLPSRIKQGNTHYVQILWALEKRPIFWDAT